MDRNYLGIDVGIFAPNGAFCPYMGVASDEKLYNLACCYLLSPFAEILTTRYGGFKDFLSTYSGLVVTILLLLVTRNLSKCIFRNGD